MSPAVEWNMGPFMIERHQVGMSPRWLVWVNLRTGSDPQKTEQVHLWEFAHKTRAIEAVEQMMDESVLYVETTRIAETDEEGGQE
jgi:hypothetical protein